MVTLHNLLEMAVESLATFLVHLNRPTSKNWPKPVSSVTEL